MRQSVLIVLCSAVGIFGCSESPMEAVPDVASKTIEISAPEGHSGDLAIAKPISTAAGVKADFTGRIRRIRIRENQNDTAFRIVVQFTGNTSDLDPDRVRVALKPVTPGAPEPTKDSYPIVARNGNNMIAQCGFVRDDAQGMVYQVTVLYADPDGKVYSFTQQATVESAATMFFKGRIHRIRIRENNNDTLFRTVIVVVGDTTQQVDKVRVSFSPTNGTPTPSPLEFETSDREGNQFVFSSLSFSGGSAVGTTYNVTATMLDEKGEQLGASQTFDVVVEAAPSRDAEVVDIRFVSKDQGKTWEAVVRVKDRRQWVEKVQVEFVKPYPGPSPLQNPLSLSKTGEEPGNVEVYSGPVRFEKSPAGTTYPVVVYLFGIGNRRTASQAGGKAELL